MEKEGKRDRRVGRWEDTCVCSVEGYMNRVNGQLINK